MIGIDFLAWAILTILVILLAVGVVYGLNYIKELKLSERQIQENLRTIDMSFKLHEADAERRFVQTCKEYEQMSDENRMLTDSKIDDVYRYVDSRFDKFENKINEKISK